MTIVVIDCETTGIPIWDQPSADPRQPHLVQLAMIQFAEDGTELSARSVMIRPDGWVIDPESEASKVHKITHERAMAEGIPEEHAVALWLVAVARATCTVAHNHPHEKRIMRIAMARAGYQKDFADFIGTRPSFCTAAKSRALVQAPPTDKMLAAGQKHAKPPKLSECVRHFFGCEIEGAHDALVDSKWCAATYWHLRGLGIT